MKKTAYLLFLFFTSFLKSNAQLAPEKLYSNDPIYSHQYTYYNDDHFYFIDTTFNSLHWYHQFNQADRDLFGYVRLGNMGAPLNPVTFQEMDDFWTYYHFGAFTPYFKRTKNIPYYQVKSPLTEANYWMGYNRGHSFNIYHTQNITEHWNAAINFKRLNSLGFLINDQNQGSSFLFNTNYLNDESGYRLYAYFLNEKMAIQEFGGLESDSAFVYRPRIDRTLLNVRLSKVLNGRTNVRSLKNQEIFIDQRVALDKVFSSKTKSEKDSGTISSDSLGINKSKTDAKNLFAIGHTFKYTRSSMAYFGTGSDEYYNHYYFTEEDYGDSSGYKTFENTIYLEGQLAGKSKINVKGGLKHFTTYYSGDNFTLSSTNLGLTGSIEGRLSDVFQVNGSADFIFAGPLNQSFYINGQGNLKLVKSLRLYGGYEFSFRPPDFYKQYYISNNFIWRNDFGNEGKGIATAGLEWQKTNHIELKNFTTANYVYFNEHGLPEQSSDVVNILRAELVQNFSFFNLLHFDNQILYNQVSSGNDVMPLPKFVTRNSIYFEFFLFKHALKCLAGSEINYFSAFHSQRYNPATGEFYLNPDDQMVGNLPILDAFANFELRKARIFLKYENASEGLFGNDYFAAPGYPLSDRVLRVGITWRFFN